MGEKIENGTIYAGGIIGKTLDGKDIYKFTEVGTAENVEIREPQYEEGDFVYEDKRIMIVKSYPSNYHAAVLPCIGVGAVYDSTYGVNFSAPTFRYATGEEKQILIDAMKKDGKRWNDDKKCIEEIPVYKDGDFLTTVSGSCFILKNICGSKVYDHAFLGENELDWDNGHCCYLDDITGYCTPEERSKVIAALKKDGKRWNAEKKCIEDIPKRKFKVGDKVRIKYGISNKTHGRVSPGFTSTMDKFIGKELTVKEYRGVFAVISEDYCGYYFNEDWLEPYVEELKKGDLAIFWDSDQAEARIGVYNQFYDGSPFPHEDHIGNGFKNAVKFERKKQFKRFIKGEL